jgi:hypothetical protein
VAGDAAARRALVAHGRTNATSYSWARSALATLDVYREVLGLTGDGAGDGRDGDGAR